MMRDTRDVSPAESEDSVPDMTAPDASKLSAKERRQLRNKVSARNFRVRRKEYISQLEALVEERTSSANDLARQLTSAREENARLVQEIERLKADRGVKDETVDRGVKDEAEPIETGMEEPVQEMMEDEATAVLEELEELADIKDVSAYPSPATPSAVTSPSESVRSPVDSSLYDRLQEYSRKDINPAEIMAGGASSGSGDDWPLANSYFDFAASAASAAAAAAGGTPSHPADAMISCRNPFLGWTGPFSPQVFSVHEIAYGTPHVDKDPTAEWADEVDRVCNLLDSLVR